MGHSLAIESDDRPVFSILLRMQFSELSETNHNNCAIDYSFILFFNRLGKAIMQDLLCCQNSFLLTVATKSLR